MAKNPDTAHIIAGEIMQGHRFVTVTDTKEIYHYDPTIGVYRPLGDRVIDKLAEIALADKSSNNLVAEVLGKIRRRTYVDRSAFDADDNLLVVGNGILNLETRELSPHTPDYLALRSIPVNFDPEAGCPTIRRFFDEVIAPADREDFDRFLGYLLIPDNRYKRALVLVGRSSGTGKTTTLRLLSRLLGFQNVSGETIQYLCDDRFSTSKLEGAIANIADDLSALGIHVPAKLKELTGNLDLTRGERKNFPCFYFKLRSKLIFACNLLPPALKADSVYYERWVIVELPNQFTQGKADGDCRIADTTLLTRMEEELPGLLNLALDQRDSLIRNNGFTGPPDGLTKQRYLAFTGDMLYYYLMSEVVQDPQGVVPRALLYAHYEYFCQQSSVPPESEERLARRLKETFPGLQDCYLNKERAWKGISIN